MMSPQWEKGVLREGRSPSRKPLLSNLDAGKLLSREEPEEIFQY